MPDETPVSSGEATGESLLSPADGTQQGGAVSTEAAITQPSNPYHSIFADEKGSFADGWQEHLKGDEFADLRATAANYNSFEKLLRGLKDSKTAAMARTEGMVRIPGENATPEEQAAFKAALGVPDSVDGYELPKPAGAPDDFQFDESVSTALREKALELNLSPAQLSGLVEFQFGLEQNGVAAQEKAQAQWLESERETLKRDFGNAFGEKTQLASRAAQTFGLDANNPIFGSAEVVKAFAAIGASISEAKLVSSESMKNTLGPESAADDIMRNESNPDYKAYRDSSHVRHKEVVAKVNDLMKLAFPEGE